MTLTRKDLEEHEARLGEANNRVVAVLKDVAVQFNTIATQLLALSRTTEAIVDAQHNSSDRIEARVKDQIEMLVKHQKERQSHAVELMKTEVEHLHTTLSGCSSAVDKAIKATAEAKSHLAASIEANKSSIQAVEKELIRSQVKFATIVGVIVGILQVATILLNIWLRPAPAPAPARASAPVSHSSPAPARPTPKP